MQKDQKEEKYFPQKGDIYGRLILTGNVYFREKDDRKTKMVTAVCKCGKVRDYILYLLRNGQTRSCGCLQSDLLKENPHNKTHGLTKHPLFKVFDGMKQRCYNPNTKGFQYWGGKGVIIAKEWLDDFTKFFSWAYANGYRKGLTIDRYPNKDGNYEPSNCRWATYAAQRRNMENKLYEGFGERKLMIDWAADKRCMVTLSGLKNRFWRDKEDWPDIELAITTPPQIRGVNKVNRAENKMITAFGETKSIKDWLSDERCVINEERLRFRVFRKSWDVEKALTTPERKLPNK